MASLTSRYSAEQIGLGSEGRIVRSDGHWWISSACRANTSKCIPIITGGDGWHTEAILQKGQADLIAIAREAMYNPNWPMDAAIKLGANLDAASTPPAVSYWLDKRRARGAVTPSTFGVDQRASDDSENS